MIPRRFHCSFTESCASKGEACNLRKPTTSTRAAGRLHLQDVGGCVSVYIVTKFLPCRRSSGALCAPRAQHLQVVRIAKAPAATHAWTALTHRIPARPKSHTALLASICGSEVDADDLARMAGCEACVIRGSPAAVPGQALSQRRDRYDAWHATHRAES